MPPAASRPDEMLPATVARSWAESETLRALALRSAELARRHARPGQYVRVHMDGAERPFALANEPGSIELELLFKAENEMTARMAELPAGTALLVSPPQGKGFPLREHEGQDLILCAAGTGIAPLRSVVRALLPERDRYGRVLFFYGQRTAAHFAYGEELDTWAARDVEVHRVASETGGRLQEAVQARRPDTTQACAYLCGMKPMVKDLATILVALGLPPDRVFLNY